MYTNVILYGTIYPANRCFDYGSQENAVDFKKT